MSGCQRETNDKGGEMSEVKCSQCKKAGRMGTYRGHLVMADDGIGVDFYCPDCYNKLLDKLKDEK